MISCAALNSCTSAVNTLQCEPKAPYGIRGVGCYLVNDGSEHPNSPAFERPANTEKSVTDYSLRCVTLQQTEGLGCTMAEACNPANFNATDVGRRTESTTISPKTSLHQVQFLNQRTFTGCDYVRGILRQANGICCQTPWSRILFEKLTGSQLVKKFPTFHGT